MRFKIWLEDMQSHKDADLQSIWRDTFKALGIGGLSDEDAAHQSLSNIQFGQRSPDRKSVFKGKQAVRKALENGQIFARLERTNDPDLRKHVEDARKWLDTQEPGSAANASTTVSVLLQKLFGDEIFQKFIDSDFPKKDTATAQVQPQPPKPDGQATPAGSMDQSTPQPQPGGPPMGGMMGQQPQANAAMVPPQPGNPMPQKPAGAELGMF
jgi:hypothetical protein